MTEERKNELLWFWGEETDDPDTQEWRDELTEEEAAVVADWDRRYEKGTASLIEKILDAEKRAAAQPLQGAGREEVSR